MPDCSDFCRYPENSPIHPATTAHIRAFEQCVVFSNRSLEIGDLRKLLRLPWAQEVRGSNPRAPTNELYNNSRQSFSRTSLPSDCSLANPTANSRHTPISLFEPDSGISIIARG